MLSVIEKLFEKIDYLKPREIEGILALLLAYPGISNNDLIRITGLPKETMRSFKAAASHFLEDTDEDSINIRKDQVEALKALSLRDFDWRMANVHVGSLADKMKAIRNKTGLAANRELDQFYATEASSVSKALLLEKKGVLDGNKIALLGDDDLVSAAISLISKNDQKVTVFDADTKLLAAISASAKDLGKENTRIIEYDARNDLNSVYKGKFDVVITDPPYTEDGVRLFLNRAVELLHIKGDKGGKYIFLYYGNSFKAPEKTIKIQEIINKLGLVIEDKLDKFAQYSGAESIGSNSSVYVLRTTPATKPITQISDYSNIYTHQQQKADKAPFIEHFTCKLHAVPQSLVTSKSALLKSLGDFCNAHKLKVLKEEMSKNRKGELAFTYMLADGWLIANVWPEASVVQINLLSLTKIANKDYLAQNLSELFNTSNVQID